MDETEANARPFVVRSILKLKFTSDPSPEDLLRSSFEHLQKFLPPARVLLACQQKIHLYPQVLAPVSVEVQELLFVAHKLDPEYEREQKPPHEKKEY